LRNVEFRLKRDLTADEQDLLTLLGTLVMTYEDEYYPDEMFELYGIDLVKVLIAEAGLGDEDLLPVLQAKSRLTATLNGEQPLTEELARRLATFFGLPDTMFLQPAASMAA